MSKSFEYFFNLITQAVHLNEQEEWLRKNCLTYSVRRFRSFVLIHTYVLTIVSQTLYFWTNCYWKIRLNFLLAAFYFLLIAYYILLIPCLLIKNNTFISNTKLKLARNQANAKQHSEAELNCYLENIHILHPHCYPKITWSILKYK